MASSNGRAWIVGNGPSLRQTPLELLNGERTFGLNRIHKAYRWTDWRPTYYVKVEFHDDEPWRSVKPHLENPAIHCFINAPSAGLCEAVTSPRFPSNASYLMMSCHHSASNAYNGNPPEKWHLPEICEFGGVTNVALQIAVMMAEAEGWTEIVLVGMDLGWVPFNEDIEPDPNHFDGSYGEWDMFDLAEKDDTHIMYHEIAKREAAKKGISIYNATIGGALEVYERVDMLEILEHAT